MQIHSKNDAMLLWFPTAIAASFTPAILLMIRFRSLKMISLLKRKWFWAIAGIVTLLFSLLWSIPALSTAPSPPQLTKVKVNGKTENVLFITRSSDTILVRCYPGFVPNLTIGKKQPNVSTTGYLKCK
jgi:hypothetical protein